jgi:hypothetical protein
MICAYATGTRARAARCYRGRGRRRGPGARRHRGGRAGGTLTVSWWRGVQRGEIHTTNSQRPRGHHASFNKLTMAPAVLEAWGQVAVVEPPRAPHVHAIDAGKAPHGCRCPEGTRSRRPRAPRWCYPDSRGGSPHTHPCELPQGLLSWHPRPGRRSDGL